MKTIERSRELLHGARIVEREGLSIRKAAEMAGIHRDLLRRYLLGRRPLRYPLGIRHPDTKQRPRRCKRCGARVYPPCLACSLRALKEEQDRRSQ